MRINLLPKEERPLRQSQVRWEFIVGLIGVVMLGAVLVVSLLATVHMGRLNRVYQEAMARQGILRRQVQEVNQIQARINALEAKERAYQELLSAEATSFADFPRVTGHGFPRLWLETVIWQPDRALVYGYTLQKANLSQYLNQLYEYSEKVELVRVEQVPETDFHIFEVEIKGVGKRDTTEDD